MENFSQRIINAGRDEGEFSLLVKDYQNFLLAEAHRNTGRYITVSDDEYAVALSAFHEAVKSFEPSRGQFLSLVKTILSRRLTDYARKNKKQQEMISLDVEEEDSPMRLRIMEKEAALYSEKAEENRREEDLRSEIEEVQKVLKMYGFSFFDLPRVSPKAEKTKKACTEVIVALLLNAELYAWMRNKKALPVSLLEKECGVPRKILERHRKYIIAGTEIFHGDYPLLAGYMNSVRQLKRQREASV